jgi:hypothetical protein
MKKYLVDIVITNKDTFDTENIEKVFVNKNDAIEYREEVLNSLPSNCYSHWAKVFTLVTCHCGEEVICSNFTNTCDNCESDYNFNGSLLASREQWGEETGESWMECY